MKAKFKKRDIINPIHWIFDGPFMVMEKYMGKYLLINVKTGAMVYKPVKDIDDKFFIAPKLTNKNDGNSI